MAQSRLSTGLCLGFGVGTIGVSIMINSVTSFFAAYMTTVLGQSAALAGMLLMLSKFYDIGADVVIGAASDRTRSRWGRRRPYLLIGSLVSALSLVMIFRPPTLGGTGLALYMLAALVIYSTGYSLFNIPYLAMPSEMTDDPHDRTRLLSFRTGFIAVGQVLALAATSALIAYGGGGSSGYALMGWVMAAIVLISTMACFLAVRRARQVAVDPKGGSSLRASFRAVYSNRPLLLLLGAKFAQYFSAGITGPAKTLFMLMIVNLGYVGQIHYNVATNIALLASMPFWLALGRRHGKKSCYVAALLMLIVERLTWLGADSDTAVWSVWARGLLAGLGSGGLFLMSIAMLPDAMDHDFQRTGIRREGLFSSVFAITEKAAYALGPGFLGAFLAASGLLPSTGGVIARQSAETRHALYVGTAVVPTLLYMVSIVFIAFYTLDDRDATPPSSS